MSPTALYGFVPASDTRNKKLGHMAYVSAPAKNCDDGCPFKDGEGCYAENPPFSWIWAKHQDGRSRHAVTYKQMLSSVRQTPRRSKLRFFVGGDFPKNATGSVDCSKATQIAKASVGKDIIVYSHHQPWQGNGAWGATIRDLKAIDFRVNISCETESQVDAYIADGIPCVLTVPSTETRRQWRTVDGNRVRVCPNQLHPDVVTCDKCMLCSKRPDDLVIAFKAHGTRVKKANASISSLN